MTAANSLPRGRFRGIRRTVPRQRGAAPVTAYPVARSRTSDNDFSPAEQDKRARGDAGTQARRHAGTQARRHAGTQARRHAGKTITTQAEEAASCPSSSSRPSSKTKSPADSAGAPDENGARGPCGLLRSVLRTARRSAPLSRCVRHLTLRRDPERFPAADEEAKRRLRPARPPPPPRSPRRRRRSHPADGERGWTKREPRRPHSSPRHRRRPRPVAAATVMRGAKLPSAAPHVCPGRAAARPRTATSLPPRRQGPGRGLSSEAAMLRWSSGVARPGRRTAASDR